MSNNHHQNKYKVLRSKSEKLVRDMAKKYGVRTPKVIKDLNKFKERVANKIEKIEYETKAPAFEKMKKLSEINRPNRKVNFEKMKKLDEINKFNKKFMKEIGDSNRAVKKFMDANNKYPMEEVKEVNIMLDEFNRKKISMDMVKNYANKVNRDPNKILDDIYRKVKAFDIETYSEVLKYYGFNNRDLKKLYKSYKKVNLRGQARLLKIIADFTKGSYKYGTEDSRDKSNARSNLQGLIDDEILDPNNKNKL